MKLSLRTKLVASSTLILIPILILLLLNVRSAYVRQRRQVIEDQVQTAQVMGAMVDDAFDEALQVAKVYASDPDIQKLDAARVDDHLKALGSAYPEYADVVGIANVQGTLIASASGWDKIKVADREWFQKVMQTRKATVSNVIISKAVGEPIVVAAVPIVTGDGKIIGAVRSASGTAHNCAGVMENDSEGDSYG